MDVEKKIQSIIPYLLKKYDKYQKGVTIDIGVGTSNFYCETFRNQGFTCYAVEPLPSDNLKRLVAAKGINLITACISNFNGKTKIYTGQWQGGQLSDLSSMHKTWWGINELSNETEVDSIRLQTFFTEHDIQNITYLKIDTEGSEWEIISQFKDNHTISAPGIVEFEYGGGAAKHEGIAGWAEEYFSKTINCISVMKSLGFKYVLLFEREEEIPLLYCIASLTNIISIFKENYVYGNLIFFKEKKFNLCRLVLILKFSNSKFKKGLMLIKKAAKSLS